MLPALISLIIVRFKFKGVISSSILLGIAISFLLLNFQGLSDAPSSSHSYIEQATMLLSCVGLFFVILAGIYLAAAKRFKNHPKVTIFIGNYAALLLLFADF